MFQALNSELCNLSTLLHSRIRQNVETNVHSRGSRLAFSFESGYLSHVQNRDFTRMQVCMSNEEPVNPPRTVQKRASRKPRTLDTSVEISEPSLPVDEKPKRRGRPPKSAKVAKSTASAAVAQGDKIAEGGSGVTPRSDSLQMKEVHMGKKELDPATILDLKAVAGETSLSSVESASSLPSSSSFWGEEGKYGWPPLIVCLGQALPEFVPAVRPNNDFPRRADHSRINTWRALQFSPPEFARTPGGPACQVAVALARLEARVGFVGRLGADELGEELLELMWRQGVMVDGVRLDDGERSGVTGVKVGFSKEGQLELSCQQLSAQDGLEDSHVDQELMEEARILYVSTLSLLTEPLRTTVIRNVKRAKERGSLVMLDVNLPLYLWSDAEKAMGILKSVWEEADVIKGSQAEIEFLINESYFERRRYAAQQYAAESQRVVNAMGDPFHYELEEVLPVLTENVKLLLVTNGTWSVHYYTHSFNDFVSGTEDVLISAFHCDRTGSGDAMTAAFLRKLSLNPGILTNEEELRKAIRFSISAGIMTQWTAGAVDSFPTENAVQNMAEQVYSLSKL